MRALAAVLALLATVASSLAQGTVPKQFLVPLGYCQITSLSSAVKLTPLAVATRREKVAAHFLRTSVSIDATLRLLLTSGFRSRASYYIALIVLAFSNLVATVLQTDAIGEA